MILKDSTRTIILGLAFAFALSSNAAGIVKAQVYGVARRTTVVSGSGGTVVAGSTTVVRPGTTLPAGYYCCLPAGYRVVHVHGVRYYTVGGIYYQPRFYSGRTVYVRVRI